MRSVTWGGAFDFFFQFLSLLSSWPVYLAQLSYVFGPRWACFQSRTVLLGVFDLPPLDLNECLN